MLFDNINSTLSFDSIHRKMIMSPLINDEDKQWSCCCILELFI